LSSFIVYESDNPDRVVEILFPQGAACSKGAESKWRRRVSSGVPFTDPVIVLADVNNPSGTTTASTR
jgi:hypothetical protein